ncbi:MAG: hypothetical protein KGZ37_00120 [Nitrosarchaeum sp.]|nr:hypothetical protein [Nitrosarchaeum sp.]
MIAVVSSDRYCALGNGKAGSVKNAISSPNCLAIHPQLSRSSNMKLFIAFGITESGQNRTILRSSVFKNRDFGAAGTLYLNRINTF